VTGFVVAIRAVISPSQGDSNVDARQRSSTRIRRASRVGAVERFDWNTLAARLSSELACFDHFGETKRLP